MVGYGENGSVVGPQNLPTSSVASGVWSLGEVAEASRDAIWPQPAQSAFEYLSGFTADGSTGTFSFTSVPQTYKTLRLVINARDTSTQYRPTIRLNNDSSANYRVANIMAENASYITYVPTSLSGINLNTIPIPNHPYTMTVDFPGYYSTAMVCPVLLWFGQSDQTTGGGSNPINLASGGLFNGSAATTRIDVVQIDSNNLGASSTVSLFGIAA